MSPDKSLQPARWRSLDGARLPPGDLRSLSRLKHQSSDGRYIVRPVVIGSDSFISRAIGHLNGVVAKFRPGFHINDVRQGPALIETETGEVTGPLPDPSTGMSHMFLAERPALVSAGPGGIYYYEFPPHRDYRWLAGWVIVPPIVLVALLKGTKFLVKRRRAQPSPTD